MTVEEQVRNLSRADKLKLMESLWTDLSENESLLDPPSWHKDALRAAEQRLESGDNAYIEWEEAKRLLREE